MSYLRAAFAASIATLFCAGSALADTRIDSTERAKTGAVKAPSTGTNNGATCKVSFVTNTANLTPPDDLTNLLTNATPYQASAVSALKPCTGNVIAFFSAEINAAGASSFLHASARATCVATGGLTNPCTVGQIVSGDPGHIFLQNGQATATATRGATWVFPQLPRGQWRFEIDVGGDGTAFVGFRTLIVEMFGS